VERIVATLKDIFWPHHNNQYQPALIQVKGLLVVFAVVLFVGTFSSLTGPGGGINVLGYATDVNVADLLTETNKARENNGLSNLVLDSKLNKAATNKGRHMIANDYWSHEAPDGTTPWTYIDEVDYIYLKAGENLAYGFGDSAATVTGWMNSPGHRANILDKDFQEVGFGILNGANFQGDENTLIVAFYTKPFDVTLVQLIEEDIDDADLQNDSATITSGDSSEDSNITTTKDPDNFPLNEDQAVLEGGVTARIMSVYQALISGEASLSIYLTVGLLMMVGTVYVLRHVRVVHRFIIVGEHTMAGHPLLEASIVYALIWLVLTATYGVVV